MSYRTTRGIVTDAPTSDPKNEADVIMTAAALGLAADYIATTKQPIQFDQDPLDAQSDKPQDKQKAALFQATVPKMDKAVADYLKRKGMEPSPVHAGVSPGYETGAMIVGVYVLAGQQNPSRTPAQGVISPPLTRPVLSHKGQALWQQIKDQQVPQYVGRGAYTGFVDNKNTTGNTDPVGPRSTARMVAPPPGVPAPTIVPHPRWLPPPQSDLWTARKRRGANTVVPWGVIGGNRAGEAPDPGEPNPGNEPNAADQTTYNMQHFYGMAFTSDVTAGEIATYTHGMIQAIYKAYGLGPSCQPYEVAVGDKTKKMASCLPCTLFMHAAGYPPTSIHLGAGESWSPLYTPYNPNGPTASNELGVVRDLNNAWYAKCLSWLRTGLDILDDGHITADHKASRAAVASYLNAHNGDPTVAGVLILDAVTIHDSEVNRISRTLQ